MTGFKSKRAAAQAIDKVNWADHEPNGRRAAAQPEQEPVAWAIFTDAGNARMWSTFQPHLQKLADAEGLTITPLYTAPPPQRTWIGLTDEDIDVIYEQHHNQYGACESPNFGYERAIEAKLKERNT